MYITFFVISFCLYIVDKLSLVKYITALSGCYFRALYFQNVEPPIYWYYMIELAFYLSLMFSQFLDVKRKVSMGPLYLLV